MENKNLPAFPAHDGAVYYGGMTKREYFAAMAMNGAYSGLAAQIKSDKKDLAEDAKLFIAMADELLKQLEQ